MDQINKLKEILRNLLEINNKPFNPQTELEKVKLKAKFQKNVRYQHKIMRVKGRDWKTKEDLDKAYNYFKM